MSKALDMSSATARVAPDLLKPLEILSNTTVRRSTVDQEDLKKTILEIRKKAIVLYMINNPIIYKFFKDFTNYRKKTNRAVVFSFRPLPNIRKSKNL